MDLAITFVASFIVLLLSVYKGIFLGYPLSFALFLFFIIAIRRGFKFDKVIKMAYEGGKKSLIVIRVFILIGAIISIWMASGTVPAIVYYGINLIKPDAFILCAFLISSLVSFLIGTSVGTSGTVGIALMVIAKGGNVSIPATAGAIIAGAYFGDRCSPMSSSANLVAFITETDIYKNIKNMFKTSIVPYIFSIVFYYIVSKLYPLHNSASNINNQILKSFNVGYIVLLPAVIIIIFSLFKIDVKISIITSIAVAFLVGVFVQHETLKDCINYIIFGFNLEKTNPLYNIIKGGGIVSMIKTCYIILVASTLSGIIEGTKLLNNIEKLTLKANSRFEIFRNMIITSIFTSAVGCSQAFAVILTHILNKESYKKNKIDNYSLAIDIENTAILIAALIPWNVAVLVPMTILGTNAQSIPYAAYIYFLPLWNLLYFSINKNKIIIDSTSNLNHS